MYIYRDVSYDYLCICNTLPMPSQGWIRLVFHVFHLFIITTVYSEASLLQWAPFSLNNLICAFRFESKRAELQCGWKIRNFMIVLWPFCELLIRTVRWETTIIILSLETCPSIEYPFLFSLSFLPFTFLYSYLLYV